MRSANSASVHIGKAPLRPRVFMMDLWATVPYYTAYLSQALLAEEVDLTIGSISYYLDPTCFSSRNLMLAPGCMDVVGKLRLPRLPRRAFKLLEAVLNLVALTVRMAVTPPDVIHVQYLPMLRWKFPLELWFLRFCRWRGASLVLTVHDLLPHDTGETYRDLFSSLYRMMDAIICHSAHVQTRLEAEFSVPAEKISVIPHGPFFYDLPVPNAAETLNLPEKGQGELLVLWQGIIFPYKGVDLLLNAWQRVEAVNPSAWLVIAGTAAPALLEEIRDQVKRLNLKQVTLHLRYISSEELISLYHAADIVTYPYRAISTSGALATGLALGKTIVASNLPVFQEMLTDGETALLVDPQDDEALAHALLALLEDASLRSKLSDGVKSMNFGTESWRSIARKTKDVYDACLGLNHARRASQPASVDEAKAGTGAGY